MCVCVVWFRSVVHMQWLRRCGLSVEVLHHLFNKQQNEAVTLFLSCQCLGHRTALHYCFVADVRPRTAVVCTVVD